MAKKITLEEYNLKNKKRDIVKIISIILNLILIPSLVIVIVCSLYYNNMLNENLESEIEEKQECINDLDYITDGSSPNIIKTKLDFYDNNTFFVIEGYGNFYYTYDCMIQKVAGEKYSYIIFNEPTAKSYGYKKGSC